MRFLTLFYPEDLLSGSLLLPDKLFGTAKPRDNWIFLPRKDIVLLCIKTSSNKFVSCVSITLLTDVTLWSKLYKQQKVKDRLSSNW